METRVIQGKRNLIASYLEPLLKFQRQISGGACRASYVTDVHLFSHVIGFLISSY